MAELTRDVRIELTANSYGVPGVYLSCEQPPNTKLSVAAVDGAARRENTRRTTKRGDERERVGGFEGDMFEKMRQ